MLGECMSSTYNSLAMTPVSRVHCFVKLRQNMDGMRHTVQGCLLGCNDHPREVGPPFLNTTTTQHHPPAQPSSLLKGARCKGYRGMVRQSVPAAGALLAGSLPCPSAQQQLVGAVRVHWWRPWPQANACF